MPKLRLRLSLAVALFLFSCAPGEIELYDQIETDHESVIIGANDLLPVAADGNNVPAKYKPLLDAFGRMLVPTDGGYALCTATHIGGGLAVAAGHCVGAPANRVNNQPCSGVKVEWGRRINKNPTLTSSCTSIVAMELNDARDYMIFKVDQAPPAAVGIDLSIPAAGTPLTIFSHPGGRPLEWSKTCSLIKQNGDHFGYQCDTQGGSSGAAVLRDDTLKVTGIHWGGGGSQNSATYLGKTAPDALGTPPAGGNNVRSVLNTGFCWDVEGGSQNNAAKLVLWPCHGGDNQKWRHEGGQLRVYANKCLDVPGGQDVNGAKLQIWDCQAGNGNQQWVREGQLWRWAGHNKCVDLTEGKVQNLQPIQIWECNGSNSNQKWQ